MGKKKTNLQRGDRFGHLKAAEIAAEIIANYERARCDVLEMRVESLEDGVWDDIVVKRSNVTSKWQVKRLMVSFSEEEAKQIITAAHGELSAVSTVQLHLAVANFVPVKNNSKTIFELHQLADLCERARADGVVDGDFEKHEAKKDAFKFVASCLPPRDIMATLRLLHVEALGGESAVRERGIGHLRDVFVNPDAVLTAIHNWFIHNPDGAVSVTHDLLYDKVLKTVAKRDPSRPPWIHLSRHPVNLTWEMRGPLQIDELVEKAWSSTDSSRLQLGSIPFNDRATSSLARLFLHQSPSATTEATATEATAWKERSLLLCGGTLGREPSSPEVAYRPLPLVPLSPARRAMTSTDIGIRLATQMNTRIWNEYISAVASQLGNDPIEEKLRDAMLLQWTHWHQALSVSDERRDSFLLSMLATVEEAKRSDFDPAIRLGTLLVGDLARTTIVSLAVAATLHATGVQTTLSGADDTLAIGTISAHAIALSAASHPETRRPCALGDAPGAMFSNERGLAILGVVEASARDLYAVACEEGTPFHLTDTATQSYRHPGHPFPIVTACPRFRLSLKKGLEAMKLHLAEILNQMNDARLDGVRRALDGSSENA